MGADYALLRCAQQGVGALRLYRWAPGCLSFGRNEPTRIRYDRDLIEERGLATVRRPTGGRAVWHDAEVTYAVAAPADRFGSLAQSYNIIHAMLAGALRRLGARIPGLRLLPGLLLLLLIGGAGLLLRVSLVRLLVGPGRALLLLLLLLLHPPQRERLGNVPGDVAAEGIGGGPVEHEIAIRA